MKLASFSTKRNQSSLRISSKNQETPNKTQWQEGKIQQLITANQSGQLDL
jgi:hypothetical protein